MDDTYDTIGTVEYPPNLYTQTLIKVNEIKLPLIQGGKLIMQIPIRNKQTRIIRN